MAGDIPVRPFTSLANEIGNAHLRRTPAEDKRGVQLISDVLPFGRLCSALHAELPLTSDLLRISNEGGRLLRGQDCSY